MEFPTLVYRCPGDHRGTSGKSTYSFAPVKNEEELATHLENGWFKSLQEAEGKDVKKSIPIVSIDEDDKLPTREELEVKANDLGIKFDRRTSDKSLLKMIDMQLAAMI